MQVNWTLLDPQKWWAAHRMSVVKNQEGIFIGDCPWRSRHKKPGSLAQIEVAEEPLFKCNDPFCESHDFAALSKKWPDGWCYSQDLSGQDLDEVDEADGFEPLGFTTDGVYIYQSVRTGHIVRIPASGHNENGLYQIVPSAAYWKKYCGGDAISWKRIASKMIRECHDRGYYIKTATRGAGMFMDRNCIVVNLGSQMLVNEKGSDVFVPMSIAKFRGDYHYATHHRLVLPEPMGKKDLDRILPIFEMMPWQHQGDALILAGAIVCGHVAGALKWRPHFWLTGGAGSGKSDIFNRIVGALQPFPMLFDGSTSAAGIRDSINNSSGLVGVDEMEKQSGSSERISMMSTVKRVDSIMEVMRSASSTGRAKVAKGGPDGVGFEVQYKCCAFFCSIFFGVEMAQDYRRFCFMRLKSPEDRPADQKARYEREIRPLLESTFTHEFAMRLYSWAVSNSRKILATIDYFKSEMLEFCRDAGEADQWSAVLGAAWALTRSGETATAEDVRAMFDATAENRLVVAKEISEAAHSEQVFSVLMQSIPQGEHMTIGAQIASLRSASYGDDTGAFLWLAQRGIRLSEDKNSLYVCVGHKQLKKIMAAEGYTDYRQAMLSRKGVRIRMEKMEFAGFVTDRFMVVPLEPMGKPQAPATRRGLTPEEVDRYGRQD